MTFRSVSAALFVVALASRAQNAELCKGPAPLEQAVRTQPSAPAFNALGAWFAQRGQLECAVSGFEKALGLEPASVEARYNLALALLQQKNIRRAVSELEDVLKRKPDMLAARNALGAALEDLGQLDRAEREYRSALELDPRNIDVLDRLSRILIGQKRFRAAIACLENAPKDEGLRTNLAIAYSGNGNPDKALAVLVAIVKSQPGSAVTHFNLATEYERQKRFRDAADEYRQVLRIDPANDDARLGLVRAFNVTGEFEQGLPAARDYAARKPDSFDAAYLLGEIYRGLDRNAEARAQFERAVELQPESYDALYNLGTVLAKTGNAGQALPHLEKAVRLRPDSSEAHYQLAAVLRTVNQPQRAAEELKLVQKLKQQVVDSDVAAGVAGRANQQLESGNVSGAIDAYREALKADPKNARTHYNLAMALGRAGDRVGERQELETSLQLDPALAAAESRLGLLDLSEGQEAQAEKRFETALESDPELAEAQNNMGVIRGRQGKNKEAEEWFRKAVENDPRYAQAYVNLALILAGDGRLPEAESEVRKALGIDPRHAGALSAQGMLESRLGRPDRAIESFRQVVVLDPKSAAAHLNLGMALADSFDLSAALTDFSQAVVLDPNSAAAHYRKGRVLFDLGRLDEARPELEAAARMAPGDPSSLYLLALAEKLRHNPARSAELLKNVIALDSGDAAAQFLLGQDLLLLSLPDEAIASFEKAADLDPERGDALVQLARLAEKHRPQDAAACSQRYEAYLARHHITSRAGALAAFAELSATARDWPEAIALWKDAIQTCGTCSLRAGLHRDLGLVYCRTGDLRNGARELRVARSINPQDPELRQSLRRVEALEMPSSTGKH